MERDVRDFLQEHDPNDLVALKVLNHVGAQAGIYVIQRDNVRPLLALMRVMHITRLRAPNWFLTDDGRFCNHLSDDVTAGSINDLEHLGNVIEHQNRHINPHSTFFYSQS